MRTKSGATDGPDFSDEDHGVADYERLFDKTSAAAEETRRKKAAEKKERPNDNKA